MQTFIIGYDEHARIGKTINLRRRLSQLQSESPTHITLLLALEGDREQELLERFSTSKTRNKWFRMTPEIKDFIAKNRDEQYQEQVVTYLMTPPARRKATYEEEWRSTVESFISELSAQSSGRKSVSVNRIWNAIGIDKDQRTRNGGCAIAAIMKELGFRRVVVREDGIIQNGYVFDPHSPYLFDRKSI